MSPFDLAGRRALITGSGQGIGLALARALAAAGAAVILNGRDVAKLERAAAALREGGATVSTAAFDVTDQKAVNAAIGRVEAEGPIDILVNNAGLTRRMPLQDMPVETWHEVLRTNLDSAFYVGQAVARCMIARSTGGKIVNVCSVQSELARPGTAPYATSKGALKMLTKAMCAEWAKYGIQANGLGPGYFVTELTKPLVDDPVFSGWLCNRTPAGRWGQVEELGGAIVFLCAPASDFVNGHILYVDGGLTGVV